MNFVILVFIFFEILIFLSSLFDFLNFLMQFLFLTF